MLSSTRARAARPGSARPVPPVGGWAALAATAGVLLAAAPAAAHVQPAPGHLLLLQGSKSRNVAKVQRARKIRPSDRFDRGKTRARVGYKRHYRLISYRTPAGGFSGSGGYSIPSRIVQCESGGNYSAANPSSGAGGAYQIMPSTWRAYGGQSLPQNASKAEQDRIAAKIYGSQGPSAWTCKA